MARHLNLRMTTRPDRAPDGREVVFIDEADGHLKSVDDEGQIIDLEAVAEAAGGTLAAVLAEGNDTGGTPIIAASSGAADAEANISVDSTAGTGDAFAQTTVQAGSGDAYADDSATSATGSAFAGATAAVGSGAGAAYTTVAAGHGANEASVAIEADATSARVLINDGTSAGAAGNFLGSDGAGNAAWQPLFGSTPEVPATPTEQDIVDALVALGLITQAAP